MARNDRAKPVPKNLRRSQARMTSSPATTAMAALIEERRQGPVGGQGHREDGRQGRQRPVHQPAQRGLDAREEERLGSDGVR
jgi:hypothetical protein